MTLSDDAVLSDPYRWAYGPKRPFSVRLRSPNTRHFCEKLLPTMKSPALPILIRLIPVASVYKNNNNCSISIAVVPYGISGCRMVILSAQRNAFFNRKNDTCVWSKIESLGA